MTAVEAEDELGKKYFYRQKTYRYHAAGRLHAFDYHGKQCFLPSTLIKPYIEDLKAKLDRQFPELQYSEVFYDDLTRRMVVDGIFSRYVAAYTDQETEEDLLKKIAHLKEWFLEQGELQDGDPTVPAADEPEVVEKPVEKDFVDSDDDLPAPIASQFPESITFVRVDTPAVEGVDVKSLILISLPSIAQFIGVKTDSFSEWLSATSFVDFTLSIHHRKIHAPEISGAWKKGIQNGLVPFLPLEMIPELLVAFKQSNRTPAYPGRAEQLYQLAKSTLEAVGLAISGNKTQAAKELARVSEGLGISAADQVIEIFKRYESRPFQVDTNKSFRGRVMKEGKDIKVVTGDITLGVTGRWPSQWLADGKKYNLPSKQRTTGREVMRTISPADSVGITFSESHYLKDSSNMNEVIETGKQGKNFYTRLKDVGLLDD
ncbi:MAG TPA: hypothetical protein VLG36_00745 [Candidatus Chromulinivoraceae bacterium]|nr:hypothetical protein [Candidatus Chromulinivoraceae bacterium]